LNRIKILFPFLVLLTLAHSQYRNVGIMINDSSSYVGYTLFTPKFSHNTYLIDNMGLLVHRWESQYNPGASAYLLEDGTLLRSAQLPDGPQHGGFQLLDWDGTVLWEYAYGRQHHDIEPMPNGNVLMITNDRRSANQAIAAGRNPDLVGNAIRSLKLIEVANTDTGTAIVWEWTLWDHLIQDYDSTKANYGVVKDHPELLDLNYARDAAENWIHPNSVDYHPEFDQVLISSRKFNEIWIIDHSTTTAEAASHSGGRYGRGGDLLYRWGNPAAYERGDSTDRQLFGQHDAAWVLPDRPGAGNITVFNNGVDRPEGAYSTVEEIIPPVDSTGTYYLENDSTYGPVAPVWEYKAPNPEDFYASRFSSAQRLPNGNTLICSGVGGIFFEVTPEKEIVWKYINPVTPDGPIVQGDSVYQNDVYRIDRYGPDYAGLKDKDLTPMGTIERFLAVADDDLQFPQISLDPNFPNPFNASTVIQYHLDRSALVKLAIFNLQGREVVRLVQELQSPGEKRIIWDGKNARGVSMPSGIYFYQLDTGHFRQVRKMILMK